LAKETGVGGHPWFFLRPRLLYTGPGAGLELISYFLGLVIWAGMAVGAVLLWPLYALLRRLRGTAKGPANEPTAAAVPESSGEPRHDAP
jgi:hypothetical protein